MLNNSLRQGQNIMLMSVIDNYRPQSKCDDTTDISSIHGFVIDRLSKKPDLTNLQAKKAEIQQALTELLTPVRYSTLQEELKRIDEAETILSSGSIVKAYMQEAQPLLDEWKNYVKQDHTPAANRSMDPERLFLVSQFIKVVRKYLPDIQFTLPTPNRNDYCSRCWSVMEANDDDTYYCTVCDNHRDFNIAELVNDHIDRITTVNNYSNLVTFHKVLTYHEGRQKPSWDPEKNPNWNIEKMQEIFFEHCTQEGEDWLLFTPRDTQLIFEEIHSLLGHPFNDHYNDVNLFTHIVNPDWELPNYSEHHKLLELDHVNFYLVYPKHKGVKKSAMNGQYLLLKLVQRRKIPYRIENFKLAETDKILIENDRICSACFAELESNRLSSGHPNSDIPWTFTSTT